jgi:Fic family protein
VPLIATKILDPTQRLPGAGRRPRPNDPAWPNAAAGAIALAAASALDLAADLSRRSNTLIAVAPKLRSKPAQKIVDLMLAQHCVSAAEAARHAPMTDRAARRLFGRLVALGAARELTGRPTFRLYGL